MAPYDPYGEPVMESLTPHERLRSYLNRSESPLAVDVTKNAKTGINDLPKEMLETIFKFLPNKRDLSQVCKVDMRFFATATPILYRDMNINITDTIDPRLTQMFISSNTGLPFVRKVSVTSTNRGNNYQAAHQWLEIFVNQLPLNKLVSFKLEAPMSLSTRVLRTLWQRQRNIHCLDILPTYHERSHGRRDQETIDLMVELNSIQFSRLSAVRIVPNCADSALLGCAALQLGIVTALEVDGRLWQEPDTGDDDDDDDDDEEGSDEGSVVHDSLTDCIFDHLQKVEPGRVPVHDQLTSLTLKDIDLTTCKHSGFCYLYLCHLKHLTLEHCKAADIFLLKASPGAATPALHSFTLLHDLGSRSDRTVHAIEELLSFPTNTLRKLVLCLRNAGELPAARKIRAHAKTLHTLLLDITSNIPSHGVPNQHLVYTLSAFEDIAGRCKSLKELGIAFPDVGLEYKDFIQECNNFASFINLVAKHLNLATLSILTWPSQYQVGRQPGYYAAKVPQLARLASDVFARHRRFDKVNGVFTTFDLHTFLEVVAFGIRDRSSYVPAPVYFMQSEVSVMDRKKLHAQDMGLKFLRSQRLGGEVVDYEKRDFNQNSRRQSNYRDSRVDEEEILEY